MTHEYGPWATLIDAGGNPELSAFWRQRLTRLAPVSRTSPALSRANLCLLGLLAALLFSLPTLRSAPALAEEDKPATAVGPSLAEKLKEMQAAQLEKTMDAMGPYIGLPAYAPLASEAVRKQLGMTAEQEQKLRDINAAFRPHWVHYLKVKQAETDADAAAAQAELRREAEGVRNEIAQLLTPQQLATLRQIDLQCEVLGLQEMPEIRKTLELSGEQSSELDRIQEEVGAEVWRRDQAGHEKALAVLTPEQREKLKEATGGDGPNAHFTGRKFSTYHELDMPGGPKELGIDDQQQAKLQAITTKYTPLAMKELPELRREGNNPLEANKEGSAQSKVVQLAEQMRAEIHAVLTPEQLAALKKLSSERYQSALLMASHIQTQIGLSDAQREELRRMQRARFQVSADFSESGKKAWAVLTPAQQAKFTEEVERRHGWLTPACYQDPAMMLSVGVGIYFARSKSGEKPERTGSGSITVTGGGTAVSGDLPKDATICAGGPIEPDPDWGSSRQVEGPMFGFPFYLPLDLPVPRQELKLTKEQTAKLSELYARYQLQFQRDYETLLQQRLDLPPEKQPTEGRKITLQIRDKLKPLRDEVEAVLSLEQLKQLRVMAICRLSGPLPFASAPDNNLTEEQRTTLDRLAQAEDGAMSRIHDKICERQRVNDDEVLAVLTSEQLRGFEQAMDEVCLGRALLFGMPLHASFTTPPGVGHAGYPVLWELRDSLRLSLEQQKRLSAMFVESKASQEIYRLSGKDFSRGGEISASGAVGYEHLAMSKQKSPEVQAQWEELKKQLWREIGEVLTPDQMAMLEKLARKQGLSKLVRKAAFYNETKVVLSDEQKEKLQQLHDARNDLLQQALQSVKEDTLNAMPADLRQKVYDEEERRGWAW